jgi:HK97 family phage prohead protease
MPSYERKQCRCEFKANLAKREFEGFASTFEPPSKADMFGDIVAPGAFAETIKKDGPGGSGSIKVLWQHIEPLGMPLQMEETEKGLWVRGRISKTALGDDALVLMDDGVVDGLSIGFEPIEMTFLDEESESLGMPIRRLDTIKLFEFSPVTWGANPFARVTRVKGFHVLGDGTLVHGDRVSELAHALGVRSDALMGHLKDRRPLRAKDGRTYSPAMLARALWRGATLEAPMQTKIINNSVTGERGGPYACSVGEKGANLASFLDDLIEGMVDEDMSRGEVIIEMGNEAGIEAGTVGQILRGEIDCPPLNRLIGFARALNVSQDDVISAAESDGCDYGRRSFGAWLSDSKGTKAGRVLNQRNLDQLIEARDLLNGVIAAEQDRIGDMEPAEGPEPAPEPEPEDEMNKGRHDESGLRAILEALEAMDKRQAQTAAALGLE